MTNLLPSPKKKYEKRIKLKNINTFIWMINGNQLVVMERSFIIKLIIFNDFYTSFVYKKFKKPVTSQSRAL